MQRFKWRKKTRDNKEFTVFPSLLISMEILRTRSNRQWYRGHTDKIFIVSKEMIFKFYVHGVIDNGIDDTLIKFS